ncbi:MAG: hypothetical protein GQ574_18815 [Crocinitomix sp.]|nr:hypothetical protein [Crocinitomix sp.]
MNRKFNIYLLGLLGIVSVMFACNKPPIEPKPDPVEQLPEATQEGKNTFGCYINGEPFVPRVDFTIGGPIAIWAGFNEETRLFSTQGTRETFDDKFEDVRFKLYITDSIGEYNMHSVTDEYRGYVGYGTICSYYHDTLNYGLVTITHLDEALDIVSGTFEITLVNPDCATNTIMEITDGRFDLRY